MFDRKFKSKNFSPEVLLKFGEAKDIICDLIIEMWRLKNRLKHLKDKLTEEDNKLIEEGFERIRDVLDMYGFEIIDYLGEDYNDGMSCRKISQEINPNLPPDKKKIKDVFRPEIRYKDKIISQAEVIVERGEE